MSFQLSPELSKKHPTLKVFTKKSSEISSRYDAQFYWENMNFDNCIKLSKIARVSGGKRLPKGFDYSDSITNYRYLRVGDINWDSTINYNDSKYISEELFRILKNYMISNGELMLAIVGATIGKCSLLSKPFDDDVILTENCAKIRLKTKGVMPEYLLLLLRSNFVQKQIQLNYIQTTLPKLGLDRVLALQIPVPPSVELQQHYLDIYQKAFHIKLNKERESQQLLDSIDNYLLGELGIELPEQEENTIQNRVFSRQMSEVSGGRFDAPVHRKKYILQSPRYPMVKFSDCLYINPLTSFYGHSYNADVTFIPMDKVSDQYGEADISNCRAIEESGGYTKFQNGDLLWAKITPCMQNGKSAVVTELKNGLGFGSTEFHVFRAKERTDINYIHGLLRLLSLREHAVLYFSGSAGHQRVADEFFKRLYIPVPPIEKQTEIANHIAKVRNKAKVLQQQANADLEKAKNKIEALILGEDRSSKA